MAGDDQEVQMNDEPVGSQSSDPPEPLRVEIATLTDVGAVRTENQDFVIATTDEDEAAGRGQLIVVADGMGGHQGGATASRLSGTTIRERYLQSQDGDVGSALTNALIEANREIWNSASSDHSLEGMGTTTSAMAFNGNELTIAHVGDSRIYRIRDGAIEQLTDDHSLVATMVKQGLITEEEAESHPRRNVLQRSMGVSEEVEIDIYGPFPMVEGDILLGCSDGLHGQMKDEEILDIVTENRGDLKEAARKLVELALERGAPDNVTVGLARVVAGGPAVPLSENGVFEVTPVPEAEPAAPSDPEAVTEPYHVAPAPKTTAAGCLLQLLLLILLAFAVGGTLLMLIDEPSVVSFFSR